MSEVKKDQDAKPRPIVARASRPHPRPLTTVWYWVIWGFMIFVLAPGVYVLLYMPAMTVIQVPKQASCPVHERGPMEEGLLPTRYQTGFGKAAWHMPRHWETWMSTTIFQKQEWLNAPPADSQKMDKVQREVRTQIPKLMGEDDNSPLVAVLQALTKETKSMTDCLGTDARAPSMQRRVSRVLSMTTDCKLRIFWQWNTMQNLALALASTESIVTANTKRLERVRSLRATIAEARGLIGRLQQKLAVSVAEADRRIVDSSFSWVNTTDVAEQYRVRYTYRNAQRQYLQLTWLDFTYSSLDGLLYIKERQISHITRALHDYELAETLASVKHGLATSALQNALNGVLDTLPYRTALFLEELRHNTTIADEHATRRASCHWMQTHAPLHEKCTCGETVGIRAWRAGWANRDQVKKWTRQHLRHLFWNELEEVKIWYDNSTEAGQRADGAEVKQRAPDIRTMGFCPFSSASAVLASKKENTSAAQSPNGMQLLSVAELRAAIFSHLDARTLFAFRAFSVDWHRSVVTDPRSREKLLLSPLAEQPCSEADLDKQPFRTRDEQNDVAFLSTSIPHDHILPSPYYSGAAIKLLNIGLSTQSGDLHFNRTIFSNHQTTVIVPKDCIDAIEEGHIGHKMLVVSPPVSSIRFEIDGVYQYPPLPAGLPSFYAQPQWGISRFGPYKLWGTVTSDTGVTMEDLQAAIDSCISAESAMVAGDEAKVKLKFDDVVLLKPEDVMGVEK
ncbi:hypothetical protein AC579_9137 [Pseudocercospora musae]|uniref:Uncharacterized protein n=1 Tax=Pseudocercospora musae TaxID=113226 RepID=A0A139IIH7_9PEZI|nr:hypothetical protein AC579_9137 [Pseudocercospora musae]